MKEAAFIEVTSQMSGVEFSTLYLASNLNHGRWSSLVICPEEGDLSAMCRASGVEVSVVPSPRFLSTSMRVSGRLLPNPFAIVANGTALIQGVRPLVKFLRKRRPALVVTKGLPAHFYGGVAARHAGIPCVWHVQDRVSDRTSPFFPWLLAVGARTLADEIIVDAESIAKQLRPFVRSEQISVIWNGVDINEFAPNVDGSHVRSEWGIDVDDLLIGVIGRLTPWKGQHVMIQAFARIANEVPRARLALIGSALFDTDEYAQRLKAEIFRLGLARRIILAGFRWDLPQVLSALDIVTHTALEKDSSPLSVISAMAVGKPIVCASVDGTSQLFEDGQDGLLYPPGDVNMLVEKLSLLLSDRGLRRKLGGAARAKAERALSVAHFAQQCELVFERALQ